MFKKLLVLTLRDVRDIWREATSGVEDLLVFLTLSLFAISGSVIYLIFFPAVNLFQLSQGDDPSSLF